MRLRTLLPLAFLVFVPPVLAQAEYASPHWSITMSDYGYSDFIEYTSGAFPPGWIHEMISGEWGAAIAYDDGDRRVRREQDPRGSGHGRVAALGLPSRGLPPRAPGPSVQHLRDVFGGVRIAIGPLVQPVRVERRSYRFAAIQRLA